MANEHCRYCGADRDLARATVWAVIGRRRETLVLCRDREGCREREQQDVNAARTAAREGQHGLPMAR